MVWASILDPKIDEHRRRNARKASKLWKHIVFGRYRFFILFLMHFSMNFGSPGRPRGACKMDLSTTFFDFFAGLSLQSCSWGLLGPFWVDISLIFGWFWHNFGSISSCTFCQFAVVLLLLLDRFGLFSLHAHAFQMFFFDRPCEKKLWLGRPKKEFNEINEWMNEMNEWMNAWMNEMNEWMNEWMN